MRPLRGQHEAAAQEIEARAPKHLALEHLEAIDVPLHGPRTPRQGHTGFDRRIVLAAAYNIPEDERREERWARVTKCAQEPR